MLPPLSKPITLPPKRCTAVSKDKRVRVDASKKQLAMTLFFNNSGYMEPCMVDESYVESYNQPRQIFPNTYLPNGYVDIVRPEVLFNTGLLHGKRILLYLTPPIPDIDAIDDYKTAKQLARGKKYLSLKEALDKHKS